MADQRITRSKAMQMGGFRQYSLGHPPDPDPPPPPTLETITEESTAEEPVNDGPAMSTRGRQRQVLASLEEPAPSPTPTPIDEGEEEPSVVSEYDITPYEVAIQGEETLRRESKTIPTWAEKGIGLKSALFKQSPVAKYPALYKEIFPNIQPQTNIYPPDSASSKH